MTGSNGQRAARSILRPPRPRPALVLASLILVAAVANLNLAVANVALPSIGNGLRRVADRAQPDRGRLLARPGRIGALPRRDRRPLRPQADADPRHWRSRSRPACSPPGRRRRRSSSRARLLGGLAAGMAYPTTLALITALWSGPGAHQVDRAVVGHRRRDLRARPAALRRPARALLVGLGLPDHAAAGGRRARAGRGRTCRATSTRRPTRSTTSAASCRSCSSRRSCWRSTSRRSRTRGRSRSGSQPIAVAALDRLRHPPAPRAEPALRPRRRRAPHLLGRRVRGDHRVRLADGRDVRRPAVPAERARLLDARGRRRRSCPRPCCMVLVAPRSAKLVEARGARFTLLVGYVFCLLGFLTMLLLWDEGIPYWKVGLGYALVGIGVGFAGTPASHSLTGSVPVQRAGMASGTADLQRDLGGAIMQSILGALLTAGYAAAVAAAIATAPNQEQITRRRREPAHQVVRQRRDDRGSSTRSTRARSSPARSSRSSTARTGPTRPASSPSCSAPRSSSSCSRSRTRRSGCSPPTHAEDTATAAG